MNFELISPEEFDGLPEDDEQCFVEFESICRRNMTAMINNDTSQNFDRSVQAQYMTAVSSVAVECGFPSLELESIEIGDSNFYDSFSRFSLAVQGEVARIRIRGRRSRGSLSVQLTDNTRTKIRHHVSRLRDIIDTSDLSASQKASLCRKLDELIEAMENRRLNLGKAMVVLSLVMAGLSGVANATTIAAEGSSAVTAILKIIGIDKESEEAALSRLAPPHKALPAPEKKAVTPYSIIPAGWNVPSSDDLDDEIPF